MKKNLILFLVFLVFSSQMFSQITLITTINNETDYLTKFKNTNGTIGFVNISPLDSTQLKVYNSDFTVNRVVKLNIPNFYYIQEMDKYNGIVYGDNLIVSTHLFNDNEVLEFLVGLKDKSTGRDGFAIVDEFSNILFSKYAGLNENLYFNFMTTENKAYLFIEYQNITNDEHVKTEVYSLPGTERFDWGEVSEINAIRNSTNESLRKTIPFPNPSHTTINLSYSLDKGVMGTLSVYDLNGNCLKTMTVDGSLPYVILDISTFKPATYIYKIESKGVVMTEKFIVS